MSETTSGINPNVNMTETSTTTDGKIELNSASGPVSFDELEQITAKAKQTKAQKTKEAKDEKAETTKDKSVDLSTDDKKATKTESKAKEVAKDGAEKSEQDKKDEAKQQQAIRKLIKAKFQEKEIDLDEEALVPVKVNGKEEMVQVKDLLGNYSGKVAWDKQFTELSKQKKAQSLQEIKLRQAAESIKGLMEEPDQDVKLFKFAQMAGIDPVQYRTKFFNDNLNYLEKWYSMSEDERKADALAYEAKFHKHRADTLENSTKQEQAQRELKAKIDNLRASHQVSEDEFAQQYDQITQMVNEKLLDESKLKPEFIFETIEKDRLWKAVDESLQDLNLPWSSEQRGQKILTLVEDAYQLGLKPNDMSEMVNEIWGQKKAQKKVQQIQEERQEFLSGKKEVAQVRSKSEEPMFFDEML